MSGEVMQTRWVTVSGDVNNVNIRAVAGDEREPLPCTDETHNVDVRWGEPYVFPCTCGLARVTTA